MKKSIGFKDDNGVIHTTTAACATHDLIKLVERHRVGSMRQDISLNTAKVMIEDREEIIQLLLAVDEMDTEPDEPEDKAEGKPIPPIGHNLTGEIKVGQHFSWEPLTKASCIIRVTGVKEKEVYQKGMIESIIIGNGTGGHWNDEDRFREACVRFSDADEADMVLNIPEDKALSANWLRGEVKVGEDYVKYPNEPHKRTEIKVRRVVILEADKTESVQGSPVSTVSPVWLVQYYTPFSAKPAKWSEISAFRAMCVRR